MSEKVTVGQLREISLNAMEKRQHKFISVVDRCVADVIEDMEGRLVSVAESGATSITSGVNICDYEYTRDLEDYDLAEYERFVHNKLRSYWEDRGFNASGLQSNYYSVRWSYDGECDESEGENREIPDFPDVVDNSEKTREWLDNLPSIFAVVYWGWGDGPNFSQYGVSVAYPCTNFNDKNGVPIVYCADVRFDREKSCSSVNWCPKPLVNAVEDVSNMRVLAWTTNKALAYELARKLNGGNYREQ